MHRRTFLTFRPEQIEEECSAENSGYRDTDEDVVRRDSNKIIVVYGSQVVEVSDEFLLVDVF